MKPILAVVIIAVLMSFCPEIVIAQTDTNNMEGPMPMPSSFDEKKSMILNDIDKKVKNLQDLKTCISDAKEDSDLKNCIRTYGPKPPRQKSQHREQP
ncbi:MAG: hypothetical protein HY754_07155 [Nitrospirae bacterium]|nr:hypothetical protein [Nitrospirota bacterium]